MTPARAGSGGRGARRRRPGPLAPPPPPPYDGGGPMSEPSFLDLIETIRERDPRYRREAYLFVMQALDRVVRRLPQPRHVSGQELLRGAVELARDQFGPLAYTVLREWGVAASPDVGRIVFQLVDAGLLGREPSDRLEDFEGGLELAAELAPPGDA